MCQQAHAPSQRKCIKLICSGQPSSSVRPKGTHEEILEDSVQCTYLVFQSSPRNTHGHISSNSSLEVAKPRSLLSVTTLSGSVHLDMASALHLLHDTVEIELPGIENLFNI